MTALEQSEVAFGHTRIAYAIRRSPRRETVAVTIDPAAGVVVSAPTRVSVERLDRIVHRKARWVVSKLRARRDLPSQPRSLEFVSGETVLYLGRHYRLRVRAGGGAATLHGGWLIVPAAQNLQGRERSRAVRAKLIRWLRAHAEQRLLERVSTWIKRTGVPHPKVLVTEQRKRWASCDARGAVRFNWRVIQAPMTLIDYVVAHELVHLRFRDHTREFWSALGRAMPDYERRREELRRLGPTLDW